jgi:hypothetical protein
MGHLPHGVTSQKTPFFIVTAMKTSNLTIQCVFALHILNFSDGQQSYNGRILLFIDGSFSSIIEF